MNYFLVWYHFTFGITTGYGKMAVSLTGNGQQCNVDTTYVKTYLKGFYDWHTTELFIDSIHNANKRIYENKKALGTYELHYTKEDTTIIVKKPKAAL